MTVTREGEPFTYDDLRSFPDDAYRRELIEGQLIVSPSPSWVHQRVVVELIFLLRSLVPPDLEVSAAPVDLVVKPTTVLIPDVLVVRTADVDGPFFKRPPLLVVEVASPSTQRSDRTLKLATYEAFGVQSYWLVDPVVPELTVLELESRHYIERARVQGDETAALTLPFPVEVSPRALVDPRR